MPDSPNQTAVRLGAADTLRIALGMGILAGAVQVGAHLVKDHVSNRTLLVGPEYLWQVPLSDAAVFGVAAILLLLISLPFPLLRRRRVVLGVFAALATFSALLLTERIHVIAEAVLALGAGVGLARVMDASHARVLRIFRRGVPLALLFLLTLGGGRWVWARYAEQRQLAALIAPIPGRPNILVLVLDTVRAWSMGLYGHPRPTTPKLQSWAARGVLFDRALAPAPWTTMSHAVMFTGRHPTELSVSWDRPLDETFPTLAELLQGAGYATGGFVANYTQAGRPTGLARGFLHYEDYPSTPLSLLRRLTLFRRLVTNDLVGETIGRRRMIDGKPGSRVSEEFLAWAETTGRRPWFAFLNYFEAHGPYLPPAPYDTMYSGPPGPQIQRYWERLGQAYGRQGPVSMADLSVLFNAYDGAIRYLDAEVDRVLRALEARGQLTNTIVVVTSDHGELFGEHGVIAHANSLYLPALHIPLLIVAPGRIPAGMRVQTPASLRDLPATLLELAGVSNPGVPGRSLVQSWNPGAPGARPDTLFAALEYNRLLSKWPPSPVLLGTMKSVVLDSLQYIVNGDGQEELYHLGTDSWQVRNLVADSLYRGELLRYRGALQALPSNPGWARAP